MKLPITDEDRHWADEALNYLIETLKIENINDIQIITPTKDFFNWEFKSEESDAFKILQLVCRVMSVPYDSIKLEFFSGNHPMELSEGIFSMPDSDFDEGWENASGIYYKDEQGNNVIEIEYEELRDPFSLTATLSHEVAHILLAQSEADEADEYKVDLVAVLYGFGIFMANSIFSFENMNKGWSIKKRGYLPQEIIAYLLAIMPHYSQNNEVWSGYLKKDVITLYRKCLDNIR